MSLSSIKSGQTEGVTITLVILLCCLLVILLISGALNYTESVVLLVIGFLLGTSLSLPFGSIWPQRWQRRRRQTQLSIQSSIGQPSLTDRANATAPQGLLERSSLDVLDQACLQAVFHEAADAIFLVDSETLLTLDCNPKAVELYEADNKQQLINIEGHRLQRYPFTDAEINEIAAEMNATGVWTRELEYVTCKGNFFWGSLAAKQIRIAEKRINLVRVADVTLRKRAEEQLRVSLQEKELLLKEVHHRVKNNLHIISSLLDLQSDYVTDENLLDLFADSQNRIQAMALIHEQLYQAKDFGRIDFSEYIHRLVSNLSFSWGNQMESVQTIIDAEAIPINLDTAIPCGLLINELVTNAFKHAFPNGRSGYVKIQLSRCPSQRFHLSIQDDGIGFPKEMDWQNSASLGLKLVQILAKQLKAEIQFDHSQGTEVAFTFVELQYRPRV